MTIEWFVSSLLFPSIHRIRPPPPPSDFQKVPLPAPAGSFFAKSQGASSSLARDENHQLYKIHCVRL